jgi:hypothetical protein
MAYRGSVLRWTALLAGALGGVCAAAGEEAAADTRRLLFFSGADLSEISSFAWIGADAALLAPRDHSGPVARLGGGVGQYSYANDDVEGGRVDGDVAAGQLMLGWRQIQPGLAITALIGAEVEHHRLDPLDTENDQAGTKTGLRIAAELWWEPLARMVVDANAQYGTAFDGYSARLAAGWRFGERMIVGPEIAALGNRTSDQVRAGLWFSGLRLGPAEVRLAGGGVQDGDGDAGFYGSVGAHMRW